MDDVLVADIGGTNARFAISAGDNRSLRHVKRLKVLDFPGIGEAIREYLRDTGESGLRYAGFAVACPVRDDHVKVTNSHWNFSRRGLAEEFGLQFLSVGNDFAALSEAVPYLDGAQIELLRVGVPLPQGNKLVLGPGTGLGVGGLVSTGGRGWAVISGDGGHIGLAPNTELEDRLVIHLRQRFGRASAERALCGDGLCNLYRFLSLERVGKQTELLPQEITRLALDESDPVAVEAAILFLDLLGSVTGDLALVMGALGGIYIGGGIMPRLRPLISRSHMFSRLVAKGRLSGMVEPMPVYLITEPHAGLLGARRQFDREYAQQ